MYPFYQLNSNEVRSAFENDLRTCAEWRDSDIVQNMIVQLGQSQAERVAPELDVHFADVDERTTEDLLDWSRSFADLVNYYTSLATPPNAWTPIFPDTGHSVEDYVDTSCRPRSALLALYLAFLELYKTPQGIVNDVTGRHLDFYLSDVLRLKKRPSVPDHAFLLVELKKRRAARGHQAGAHLHSRQGCNWSGADLRARARVWSAPRTWTHSGRFIWTVQVMALFALRRSPTRLMVSAESCRPMESPSGEDFGYPELSSAEIGFAVASPVLRMTEG